MIHILVCFKVVPDWDRVLEEDWDEFSPLSDLAYAGLELNCFDESALELALQLKDDLTALDEDVICTAVTANALHASFAQTLFAVGFDDVITLGAEYTEFDPQKTAGMLAAYIGESDYDVILTGCTAGMADSGMVPYYLAAKQNIPIVSEVENVRWKDEGLTTYSREEDGLWERGVRMPCVVSVGNSPAVLRAVTLRKKLEMRDRAALSVTVNETAIGPPQGSYQKRSFERVCEKVKEDTAKAVAQVLHKQLSTGTGTQREADQTEAADLPKDTIWCPLDGISPFDLLPQLQAIIQELKQYDPTLILLPNTKTGRELAVRLTEQEQMFAMTDVSLKNMEDKLLVQKSVCSSNVAWLQEISVPAVLTMTEAPHHVPSVAFERNGSPPAILYEKQVEEHTSSAVHNDELVIVCGAGMGSKEDCDLARALAEKLHAGFGLTRQAAVSGWGSTSEIVGQSGVYISPKVCLVLGASGASAFTVGIEHSQHILAVNTDDCALIFKQADVGAVADATDIVRELLLLV